MMKTPEEIALLAVPAFRLQVCPWMQGVEMFERRAAARSGC